MSELFKQSTDGEEYATFWISALPATAAGRPHRISVIYDFQALVNGSDDPSDAPLLLTSGTPDATRQVNSSAHDAFVRAATNSGNYINALIQPTNVYPSVDLEMIIPRNMALLPIMRYVYSTVFGDVKAKNLGFYYKGRLIEDTDCANTMGI